MTRTAQASWLTAFVRLCKPRIQRRAENACLLRRPSLKHMRSCQMASSCA